MPENTMPTNAAPAACVLDLPVGRPVPERLGARVWQATRRLMCPHTHGRLQAIEWDGTAVYECAACGKRVEKPL